MYLSSILISTQAPAKMQDAELEKHIKVQFLQLNSITLELSDCWNSPIKQAVMPRLREQLVELSAEMNAALEVWNYRMEMMR